MYETGPSNGSDVYAFNQDDAQIARISIDHSYYFIRNVRPTMTGPVGIIQDDGTDVRGPQPKFAAAGDYHQAAGSSTIDKGATSPANGAIDLDGDPRALGKGGTDIGADEFVPPPSAVTGNPGTITMTDALVNGSVNPNSVATSYHFEYGTTSDYGTATPSTDAGSGFADVAVSASLTGLTPATTYHYRLVAASARGTTTGADRTLVTQSPPGPGPPSLAAKLIGPLTLPLTLEPSVFEAAARGAAVRAARRHTVGTLARFRLSAAAPVTLRVERCAKLRKSRCTRFSRLRGIARVAGAAGANRFRFSGRWQNKKLKPGRYRLVAIVGNPVSTRRASFRIVPR